MFLIFLLIAAFIVLCFGAFFWIKYASVFGKKIVIWATVACLVLGGTCGLLKEIGATSAANLKSTHDELMLYHQTVTNSTNEYIRNHYYGEVQEYNRNYEKALNANKNIFYNVFYPDSLFKEISIINFELRRDTPVGDIN